MPKDVDWIEIPTEEQYESFDYHGGCLDIAPIQNYIDEKIVENYRQKI